jgi:glycolate oxidase iron-sulfur subunit
MPGLARTFPPASLARTLGERMPRVPKIPAFSSSAREPTIERGPVTLFRGCVASVYDRDTHAAARHLLEALGHEVRMPNGTPCCGALARHAGAADDANRQSNLARKALDEAGGDVVLVSASGCFGDLRDHVMRDAKANVVDVLGFIARDERISRLRFRPLEVRAALHLPCTQVNVVGETGAIRALLARIPGLHVLALPEQPRCCGAAGTYFIEHPEIADRLRAEKLQQALHQRPDLILTTNIGCRIHLANGLREHEPPIPVAHPLVLLAQQLENAS